MSRNLTVMTVVAVLLAVVLTGCGSAASSQSSTGAQGGSDQSASASGSDAQLGQQIFATGNGADGAPIAVSSGAGGPCARCHGNDARGKVGPDIRWSVLTGATSSPHPPRFPIASEPEFTKAVTTGDVAGNQLRQMMPHYQLTPAQATALAAYLKTL